MKVTITMLTALFCAVMISRAQSNGMGRVFGDGTLPEFLAVYDTDDDGVLSEEERQAMRDARRDRHDAWVDQWDTDGDGVLSEAEREAARQALRDRIEARRTERFEEADTDGDGFLSFDEFMAIPAVARLAEDHPDAPAIIFARMDADDDGLVSLEEFLAHLHRPRHRPRPPLDGGDGWGDGGGGDAGGGEPPPPEGDELPPPPAE